MQMKSFTHDWASWCDYLLYHVDNLPPQNIKFSVGKGSSRSDPGRLGGNEVVFPMSGFGITG